MSAVSDTRATTIDGNEAVALIAHKTNEVIAIYPITPASPMGEYADAWSNRQQRNIFGSVPRIIEMQSEGGAAGAIHGALQAGALTTTFTASQGLLLMLPNMYKIAGELSPTVFHIAARSVAAQALSIFADHSDVMAARATGFALLASNSVQEAHDMALISQAATLASRIPVLHFFDGFRTSHEIAKISLLDDDTIAAMIDGEWVAAHRRRALSPDHPVIRGTSQNPDVFFQARETVNPYYSAFADILRQTMDRFARLTGRQYGLFDYVGAADAERVIVLMGSGAETADETVRQLTARGEKVGVIKVRCYRPFSAAHFLRALPAATRAIAVLDRTKEPGAEGEPLYKDIASAVLEAHAGGTLPTAGIPRVVGGRYGLSSKEFTPAMVCAVLENLAREAPKNHFTAGIHDDVGNTSLPWDDSAAPNANVDTVQCLFYGLGSDGTVGANKNSIKIIGEQTELYAQGYFVYDSKKSGAVTVSHLRFGREPIRSTYLIGDDSANFVGCHQTVFLEKYDMLKKAAPNGVFLLNTAAGEDAVWDSLPRSAQQQILDKHISLYIIDAYKVAKDNGMGRRINTVMQTCFFAISGVLPGEKAIAEIKASVERTYGKKGRHIVRRNFEAIDKTLAALKQVEIPATVSSDTAIREVAAGSEDAFIRDVTAEIIAGRGDLIPVSRLPVDGTYPTGTAAVEKRNIALEIPVWDQDLCTHCGKCAFVCPHGVIRSKAFPAEAANDAPATFKHVQILGKDYPQGVHISYQVSPEDCTGCTLCVDICPIRDKSNASHKAVNMAPLTPELRMQESHNWAYFLTLPDMDRREVKANTMKGSMLLETLFEFSGACSGCGETPYIKLASQLFGDRMVVANATGCSSIYGGNLPTTPWAKNSEGRGPAWNNSLFEDNAEFGLGIRAAYDQQLQVAEDCLRGLGDRLPADLVAQILGAPQESEADIHEQRQRVERLKQAIGKIEHPQARLLASVADALVKKSIWIIGGDGWAYDIGYGGLDHVLASGMDVNILVLDTEVYSNTGGQTSKATPRGAVAKFSAGGKPTAKKDLARIAMAYESVYVAHVAYGAKDTQTLHAFLEAEAYPGPSLIIAYAPCIAHGVDLANNHRQQNLAVDSGHWPLFRFDPRKAAQGKNPLKLDSRPPSIDYGEFMKSETRFSMLWNTDPERARTLLEEARREVTERFERYQQLASLDWDDGGEG